MPCPRRICGSIALWPNGSTFIPTVAIRENRDCRYRWPYRPCRTKLSAPGMLQSGSTHQPPTFTQRPSATRAQISAKSSGSDSSTHDSSTIWSQVKTKSGYSFIRSSADRKVARASW